MLSDHVVRDEPRAETPVLRRTIDGVPPVEAIREFVSKGIQLAAKEDIFLSLVGKKQRQVCLVGRIVQDCVDDAKDGREASAARDESDVRGFGDAGAHLVRRQVHKNVSRSRAMQGRRKRSARGAQDIDTRQCTP